MGFLGALVSGIEAALGEPAKSISYLAGGKLGARFAEQAARTADIEVGLDELRRVLVSNSCLWQFETFKPKDRPAVVQATPEGDEVLLVFRDCMIRQSLFRFGHQQKGSLCTMMNGFFAAALHSILGRDARLEISHAGENACYKRLVVSRGSSDAMARGAAR
jgi:predicted hydrocarbon binding protein